MAGSYDRTKRVFDLVVATTLLVATSPILLVIAVAVRLTSRGPVLYRGERVGRHGETFHILKFRTMSADAERHGTTTSLNDWRITPVGRWLRRSKLDELPQLVNVIRGEMSLVGPRPEVEEHTSEYTEEEQLILSVLPGITDLSSIRFARLDLALGAENAHQVYLDRIRGEKNALRLKYVRERSFSLDLRILWMTAVAIVRPERARV
jgi:lipopolysaccharide/colanic/teichoic acid biosynthesis glycosyltransferase